MVWKYVAVFCSLLVGIAAVYKDLIKEKFGKHYKKILIVGLIVSAVYSGFSLYDSNNKLINEKNKKSKDSIKAERHFDTIIVRLKSENELLINTRDTLSSKLAKASIHLADKISKSGNALLDNLKDLNNQVTGGDAYLDVNIFTNTTKDYNISFKNNFNHSIPIEWIGIIKYDEFLGCPTIKTPNGMARNKNCIDLVTSMSTTEENYPPSVEKTIKGSEKILFTDGIDHKLFITVVTHANSYYYEFIYWLNNIGQGGYRYKIYKLSNDKIIQLKIYDSESNKIQRTTEWETLFNIKPYNYQSIKF